MQDVEAMAMVLLSTVGRSYALFGILAIARGLLSREVLKWRRTLGNLLNQMGI